ATLVPAFDDPRVIAGQGTLMLEVLEQLGRVPDVIVVPVGGGGLLAGSIVALGDRLAQTRLVGVEPAGAAALRAALDAGHPVVLPEIDTFADGAATKKTGDATYSIIAGAQCEVTSVKEGAICVEMLALYQDDGIIAEPAGALATAALPGLDIEPGQTVVCVLSGGNNDVSRYAEIVERA
ncbi:MAG TPA: pyridoxal-phosphate dependent enzyme, partial [Marmoricola sp.]|nr:pyridoxal-phosphate dependent enzyme [Marmoricola sp.]